MAISYFVRFLLRNACLQGGRPVLEALVTGQFAATQQGGLQMISSTTAGQSFSFGVDPKLSASELAERAEEALRTFNTFGTVEAVRAMLDAPPVTVGRAFFA